MPLIAAGAAAGGQVLGGVMGGKGAKKSAKIAAKSAEKITQMNNALVREMYGQNALRLDPYSQRGNQAGNVLQEILLGSQAVNPQGATPVNSEWNRIMAMHHDGVDGNLMSALRSFAAANPNLPAGYTGPSLNDIMGMVDDGVSGNFESAMAAYGSALNAAVPQSGSGGGGSQNALSAWDQFKQGSMYQNRLQEGQNALNSAYAARGALQSGAAQQALQEHGQMFASQELGNWMNMLSGQQNVGLSAANALAGVGTNMVGQISANNNNMGAAQANAALVAGQANQQMWGNIGQGIGIFAGALGSSYNNPYSGGYGGALTGALPNQLPAGWGGW